MNRLLCLLAMPQAHRCKGEEGCRKQLDEDEAAHGGVNDNNETTAALSVHCPRTVQRSLLARGASHQ